MDIGNQIKALRQRRGITQEAMAQHFGITPQAVSKWERSIATPDISMLPGLSAYFGVTIDELFSLSDDTRMDRMDGDIAGAITARELEITIAEEDWHDTTGESVEVIRRELNRLQTLL